MSKDDELTTLSDTIARLEKLPELNIGRVWLNALKAIAAEDLETVAISGPDEYDSLVWESMITVGSLSDGKPRFHVFPPGTAADDLAARDASVESIMDIKGPPGDAARLIALAKRKPSTTFAVLVRARAGAPDGPLIVELLHHPSVSRRDAAGWLKLTAEYIRKSDEKTGSKN